MRYVVVGRGRKQMEVQFTGAGRVLLNGQPFEVEIVREGGGWCLFRVNRSYYFAEVRREPRRYEIRLHGKTYPFIVETPYLAQRAESQVVTEEAEVVRSPIPGKIVAILVEVGDRVEEGTPLLLLEAMKMQNEITALRAGVVREILVEEDQAISMNEPLLVIE